MKRIIALFGLAAFATAATPASSQVILEMSEITCKQFSGFDDDTKALVAAWVGGYYSAGKNLNVVQSQYVERNLEKTKQYCKKHKNDGLLASFEKIAH